jgi:hypothetical protein
MIRVLQVLLPAVFLVGCSSMGNVGYLPSGASASGNSSAFPSQRAATGKKTFVFSPKHYSYAAYNEEGQRVRVGHASGGSNVCPEANRSCRTVTGNFAIHNKGGADCTSSKYPLGSGGAPMAYCMHFHKGFAIHGAPGGPTGHQSHGCIRVQKADARWLNEDFLSVGDSVIVQSY